MTNQNSQSALTAPIFFVLTRTSGRPHFFHQNYLSVKNQTYDQVYHYISVDDDQTEKYVRSYAEQDFKCQSFRVTRIPRQGSTHFPYNLYLNEMLAAIPIENYPDQQCWVLFLDDDDIFTSPNSLTTLAAAIQNPCHHSLVTTSPISQNLFYWPVQFPNRLVPKRPFLRRPIKNQFSMIGMCFPVHFRSQVSFQDQKGGDYLFLKALWPLVQPHWLTGQVLTQINYETPRRIGSGQRNDLAVQKGKHKLYPMEYKKLVMIDKPKIKITSKILSSTEAPESVKLANSEEISKLTLDTDTEISSSSNSDVTVSHHIQKPVSPLIDHPLTAREKTLARIKEFQQQFDDNIENLVSEEDESEEEKSEPVYTAPTHISGIIPGKVNRLSTVILENSEPTHTIPPHISGIILDKVNRSPIKILEDSNRLLTTLPSKTQPLLDYERLEQMISHTIEEKIQQILPEILEKTLTTCLEKKEKFNHFELDQLASQISLKMQTLPLPTPSEQPFKTSLMSSDCLTTVRKQSSTSPTKCSPEEQLSLLLGNQKLTTMLKDCVGRQTQETNSPSQSEEDGDSEGVVVEPSNSEAEMSISVSGQETVDELNDYLDMIFILDLHHQAEELQAELESYGFANLQPVQAHGQNKTFFDWLWDLARVCRKRKYRRVMVLEDNVHLHCNFVAEFSEQLAELQERTWRMVILSAPGNLAPSSRLDANFYLDYYPDVAAAKVAPEKHYKSYGLKEKRFPCRGLLAPEQLGGISGVLINDSIYDQLAKLRNSRNVGQHLMKNYRSEVMVMSPLLSLSHLSPSIQKRHRANLKHYRI